MCIKILGEKKIRDNGVIVFRVGGRVFKLPLMLGAMKETLDEKERIKKAKENIFFSQYLPDYKFFLFFQTSPYFKFRVKVGGFLIKRYFEAAFKDMAKWETASLEKIVDKSFMPFIKKYFPEDFDFCDNYLKKISTPFSSAHGDFHPENILADKDRLFFIDWSRYSERSSRHFDLYDYYIFSKKEKGESWIKAWRREFDNFKDEILGVKTKKEYLLAYGIWKAAEDIRVLKLRGKLDNFKIKKYINFIKILKGLF